MGLDLKGTVLGIKNQDAWLHSQSEHRNSRHVVLIQSGISDV